MGKRLHDIITTPERACEKVRTSGKVGEAVHFVGTGFAWMAFPYLLAYRVVEWAARPPQDTAAEPTHRGRRVETIVVIKGQATEQEGGGVPYEFPTPEDWK